MKESKLVAICIPCYNNESVVHRLIRSILCQDYQNYIVFISDDTEADCIEKAINAYNGKLEIRYHHNKNQVVVLDHSQR